MTTSTLILIAEDGSQWLWDATFGVMFSSGFYLAIVGVGLIMGMIALTWWGVTYLFPRRLRR